MSRLGFLAICAALLGCAHRASGDSRAVLVTIDGARWQEIFRGADPAFLTGPDSGSAASARAAFGRPNSDEARRALMPFLWDTVAHDGQIFGNVERASPVLVTNPIRKSYPGYHELLCGFSSPVIVSNLKLPNPDVTVLEWLNRKPGFAGVAAFVSWDVFDAILNPTRSGLLVSMGHPFGRGGTLDRVPDEVPPPWSGSVYDAFVFRAGIQHLEQHQPRVLYVALGDTDEWAHAGRYDRYLEALHRSDAWLRELWEKLQSLPAYRGHTSLIVTADHGRGDDLATWRGHGPDVPGSEHSFVAVLGPGTAPLGERHDQPTTLAQVAATVAALVGQDYTAAVATAARPMPLADPAAAPVAAVALPAGR
jgi:hypothetical protein